MKMETFESEDISGDHENIALKNKCVNSRIKNQMETASFCHVIKSCKLHP